MTDKKISELTAIDAVTGVDLLAIVDDPAGTPATKKATAAQVKDYIIGLANTWSQNQTFSGGVNKVTITAPATGSTLTIADGKTLTANNTLTLAGTDSTTMTFPSTSATLARTDAANSFTGNQTLESTAELLWSTDLRLTRRGAANLRLGAADAAGSAISISSVASNRLTLASDHGLSNGAAVQITFTAGGAVPAGTAVNTTYYARSISAAVLELYGTYDQALNTASTTGRVAVTTAGTTAFVNRATPFQTLSVQSFTGTDIPGQPFVITGSQGTGTGRGGDIIFQVAPAGSSGTAQNALATALTIDSSRVVTINTQLVVDGMSIYSSPSSTKTDNAAVGTAALFSNTSGTKNTAFGRAALFSNTSGSRNTAVGSNVLYGPNNSSNTGVGSQALAFISGDFNTAVGDASCGGFNGSGNTALGALTLSAAGSGNNNIAIGYKADEARTAGNNNIVIGFDTDADSPTASDQINIGNVYFHDRLRLKNTASPSITFGGTTSSFPALKRSSATLQVRLADDSADAGLQCAALTVTGNLTISTKDIVTDTTTGTKIGTGTTQKIGFYNKTPVVQPTAVADATDAATVITQLNALLSRMRDLGLIAT